MKKIYTCILLNVFIFNEISSTFSSIRDYPCIDEYYSHEDTEKAKCENLDCQKSELSVVEIELLLNTFNQELNIIAQKQNLSYAFRLYWNEFLAQLAQNKSGKCLPVTHKNGSQIFSLRDVKTLSHNFNKSSDSDVELEVLIGERSLPLEEIDYTEIKSKMIEEFTELFFSSRDNLLSRALNRHVGCGYVYMEKDGKIIDRLLCIFGFMHIGKYNFTAYKGIPCSKCDAFYKGDLNQNGTIISKNITWICNMLFPYLCTDSKPSSELIEAGPYAPYCPTESNKSYIIPYINVNYEIPSLNDVMEEWPCLPIFIPMALLIIIFLALAIYHFVMALKLHYFEE